MLLDQVSLVHLLSNFEANDFIGPNVMHLLVGVEHFLGLRSQVHLLFVLSRFHGLVVVVVVIVLSVPEDLQEGSVTPTFSF